MQTLRRACSTCLIVLACVVVAPHVDAQPRGKPKLATQADLERLEQRLEAQQRLIEQLIALHQQYLRSVAALVDDAPPPAAPGPTASPPADLGLAGAPAVKTPAEPPAAQPTGAATDRPPAPRVVAPAPTPRAGPPRVAARAKPRGVGTLVGKVTGAPGAVIYVEDIVVNGRGTAAMKQEGKQFKPSVLVVQKGATVAFPNLDAIFHNVFSVSPDNTFDLGSYPKGESRSVTMSRVGVVTVYCNMHPQMVGYILVVPNGNYARAGADGFFRLTNVPAGPHRVVVWAPNAKPAKLQANVGVDEVVTLDVVLSRTKSTMHTKSDGLPYGSYEQ